MINKTLSKRLRILIPMGIVISTGAALMGVFLSPAKDSLFVNQSSIYAGYDQNFRVPIYKNEYKDYQVPEGSLQILSPPDLKKQQSYDLKLNNDYSVNQLNTELIKTSNQAIQTYDLWKLKLTRQQVINNFQNRFQPWLAMGFGMKFQAFDATTNQTETVDFKNLLMGFALTDLMGAKTNTYPIFNYSVNDNFANLTGNISGQLVVDMNHFGDLTMAFQVNKQVITTNSDNNSHNDFSFQLSVDQTNPKVFLLWDVNQRNDLLLWFWPQPNGPVQNSKINTPIASNYAVGPVNSAYALTLKSATNADGNFHAASNAITDFNDTEQKGQASNETNLITVKMRQEQWQDAFFNSNTENANLVPKNPGFQLKFQLYLSVLNNKYNIWEEYNTALYGYFNMGDLIDGRTVEQTITDYDLSDGRPSNEGKFAISEKASLNLKKELTVSINVNITDLKHLKAGADEPTSSTGIKYRLGNVEVFSFPSDGNQTVDKDSIGPKTQFNFNLSNAQYLVNSQQADLVKDYYNTTNGRERHSWGLDPYLRDYNTVWNSWQNLNIANYVENNQDYAKKSHLTFSFGGTAKTDNSLDVKTVVQRQQLQQLKIWNPGFDDNNQPLAIEKMVVGNSNLGNDLYTSFQINIEKLTSSEQDFEWRRIYTFWENRSINAIEDQPGWDSNIFTFNRPSKYSSTISSMMRIKYFLRLALEQNNNFFKIKYQIGTSVSAYQWNWGKGREAAQGIAGFSLNNIQLNIKTE